MEHEKQLDLETRMRNLRAEGKTYREIAEILHVSIAHISRTLKSDHQKSETVESQQGEVAARVFQLLEKGRTLPQVVIKMKLEPEVVEDLYNKWAKLKEIDVNQPNLERLDEKLRNHIWDHYELNILLEQAVNIGTDRKNDCGYKSAEGLCIFSSNTDEEVSHLRCVFCNHFVPKNRDTIITI